jgi:hypothetical protein
MTIERCISEISDGSLLDGFAKLVQQDQQHTASLLRHIDAIDRRKLWAKKGHPSMFDFCVVRFRMSESTAGKRIGAARTARRFPVLFGMIARGEVHLGGIYRLKAHLTPENHQQVLGRAKHKTIKQIELLVAELAPQPDAPSSIRRLPASRKPVVATASASSSTAGSPATPQTIHASSAAALGSRAQGAGSQGSRTAEPEPCSPELRSTPSAELRAPDPQPLAPSRYKLQVTLDQTAREHLSQLQDLLAHQIPSGDPAAIVQRALALLLADTQKKKFASTNHPRAVRAVAPIETRTKCLEFGGPTAHIDLVGARAAAAARGQVGGKRGWTFIELRVGEVPLSLR